MCAAILRWQCWRLSNTLRPKESLVKCGFHVSSPSAGNGERGGAQKQAQTQPYEPQLCLLTKSSYLRFRILPFHTARARFTSRRRVATSAFQADDLRNVMWHLGPSQKLVRKNYRSLIVFQSSFQVKTGCRESNPVQSCSIRLIASSAAAISLELSSSSISRMANFTSLLSF